VEDFEKMNSVNLREEYISPGKKINFLILILGKSHSSGKVNGNNYSKK